VNDVLSGRCRRDKSVVVRLLTKLDRQSGKWRELFLVDCTAGPAEDVVTWSDFGHWLGSLSRRDRRLAEAWVVGETTGNVARTFRRSAGRVTPLRRTLCDNWFCFIGELADASERLTVAIRWCDRSNHWLWNNGPSQIRKTQSKETRT
jgi:hypothetical protein